MKKILKSAYENNPLKIGEIEIKCAVLEDGTRVLSQASVTKALGLTDGGSKNPLPRFVEAKPLHSFIGKELEQMLLNPILYKPHQGEKANGIKAEILPMICEAWIDAKDAGELKTLKQKEIAEKAKVLHRGFARVGIVALVDEASGYQYDREKDALHKILKSYIAEELLPWQKKFPDVFYTELFRLNGWNFTVKGIKKRPGVVGTWTNKLIYEQLPEGILKELKKKTPKDEKGNSRTRLHQFLTNDIGNPHLKAQINQIVTLFQLSDNMEHMWEQFDKLKKRQAGQLEMPFKFDENGYTIEK